MHVCPLCNQFSQLSFTCNNCKTIMDDHGRLMDFFDDYSAYLDIEGMKLFDGYPTDQKEHSCPHVFYCEKCNTNTTVLISEYEL